MKKNFISILILGCTLINVVLSAITMFSVVSTNQKTADIVTSVAKVLDLELSGTEAEEKENHTSSLCCCVFRMLHRWCFDDVFGRRKISVYRTSD